MIAPNQNPPDRDPPEEVHHWLLSEREEVAQFVYADGRTVLQIRCYAGDLPPFVIEFEDGQDVNSFLIALAKARQEVFDP